MRSREPHKTWSELINKSLKLQDHANRRNAGEEITLGNKLKQLGAQKKLTERNFDIEIKCMIEKQRKLGHRTFSLPDELDLVPAPATPLKKRILRAGKIDRVDLDVDFDQRSVQSERPYKRLRSRECSETFATDLRRYNTMEVLAPEPTVMNALANQIRKTQHDLASEGLRAKENGTPGNNIQR